MIRNRANDQIKCLVTPEEVAQILQKKTGHIEDPRLKRLAILETLNEIMLATAIDKSHPAYQSAMETRFSRAGLRLGTYDPLKQ